MDFYDVIFPLHIGSLTYCLPSGHAKLSPGMVVRAEVKKSIHYGIVLGRAVRPPEGPLKEIAEVVSEKAVVSDNFLRLLNWMSEYYLVPEGAVLKSASLMEYLSPPKTKSRPRKEKEAPQEMPVSLQLPAVSGALVAPVRASLSRHAYKTYLLHAPSIIYEISSLCTLAQEVGNVIILVPEITHIELLLPYLKGFCRERLAILHGRLPKADRRRVIERIISGDADIVTGTRIAVTAPLPSVSLIAVLQEQNQSYKNLEGVRYHARDVAVMRGYLEQSTVILSSTMPSVESFYNVEKKKYGLLNACEGARRPRIEVVNMKTAAKATPYLCRKSLQAASSAIKDREGVLFFLNRKGYSLIQCAECGTVSRCPLCRIPLIYHKNRMVLRCHYCNHTSPAPDTCETCGSTRLETVGAGTQRIEADIRKYLNAEPVRIDRDALRDVPALKGLPGIERGDEVIVGTKAITGRLRPGEGHRICVFLNPDISLHLPDFRSSELLFQEIIGITEFVKPDGLIILQTKMPENHVFRCVRGYRFREFYLSELAMRKSLAYPPFARVIVMTLSSSRNMIGALTDAFAPSDEIEIFGPLPLPSKRKHVWKVILKSVSKGNLSEYARNIMGILKEEKGLRTVVDVDPIGM